MRALLFAVTLSVCACSPGGGVGEEEARALEHGEVVDPPFEVRGDAEGLLLAWFDEDGLHTATRRDAIPEAHRERVRVSSLDVPPDERDPDHVFVADLSVPVDGDRYEVRRVPRERFDQLVEEATEAEILVAAEGAGAPGDAMNDVVIYGASWCNACRSAAAYLRQREVPFVERDVEREPGARQAMLEAAREAGVQTRGIPVIDFRGTIIAGFDRGALDRAIERSRTPI